jgi:hypothetical protein
VGTAMQAAESAVVDVCDSAGTPSREANDATSDGMCAVCLDEPITHIFVPCGHCCVCGPCGAAVMAANQQCPNCRGVATMAMKVYYGA